MQRQGREAEAEITQAAESEANTSPKDKVNIDILSTTESLPGPKDKEVKMRDQAVSTRLIYVLEQ